MGFGNITQKRSVRHLALRNQLVLLMSGEALARQLAALRQNAPREEQPLAVTFFRSMTGDKFVGR